MQIFYKHTWASKNNSNQLKYCLGRIASKEKSVCSSLWSTDLKLAYVSVRARIYIIWSYNMVVLG